MQAVSYIPNNIDSNINFVIAKTGLKWARKLKITQLNIQVQFKIYKKYNEEINFQAIHLNSNTQSDKGCIEEESKLYQRMAPSNFGYNRQREKLTFVTEIEWYKIE